MSNLVLLTKNYPFGIGEEFVQGEVEELAKHFSKMTIIACQVPSDSVQTKETPKSVQILRINETGGFFRKLLYCISGLRGFFNSSVRKEIMSANSIMAKGSVFYYVGKTNAIYAKIVSAINKNYKDSSENTIFYSYWLYGTAEIACRLRDSGLFVGKCISVSRGHGYDVYSERNKANWIPFQAETIRALDLTLVCSNHGRDYLRQRYPKQQDKIMTSYLGTADCGIGNPSHDKTFHLVTCSWLARLKRIDLLIDALAEVQQRHKIKLKWTCIGDGILLEHYKKRVANELTHMEVIMTGALTKEQLYNFYRDIGVDLFVNVSESEGLPVSIMEAQSFGIPSLATDAGGTREIVKTGETGLLIPVESTAIEIADALDFFIKMNEQHMQEYRKKCRTNWKENFDAMANYSRFIRLIKSLIGE